MVFHQWSKLLRQLQPRLRCVLSLAEYAYQQVQHIWLATPCLEDAMSAKVFAFLHNLDTFADFLS